MYSKYAIPLANYLESSSNGDENFIKSEKSQ
jgi:hypothetical protein